MKILIRIIFITIIFTSGYFFWLVWQNNKTVTPVSAAELEHHFLKSVTWLETNYPGVENIRNPILWWMIKQAAEVSGNETLNNIYTRYRSGQLDTNPPNLSTPMFDKFYHPVVPDIGLLIDAGLSSYQIFFFYGLSCDNDLGSEPVIQQQLLPSFCSMHYLHPRCITHQLMGLRFMQRYQCGNDELVNSTIDELQKDVVSEMTWDFRVGDAYIQRTVMLVDTGAINQVKPVWINNILNAQNEDGSWDDLHPIISFADNRVFAFTSFLPKLANPEADFHTTAQAIWLLSMLLDKTGNQQ